MARQTARKKEQKRKKDRPVRWTDVSGVMRVYGHEFETKNRKSFIRYSTSIGRKNEDGDYENAYLTVFFPKNDAPDIEGSFEVNITKGFMTLNVYDKGKGKNAEHIVEPAVMVQEYVFVDDEQDYEDDQEDDEDKPF